VIEARAILTVGHSTHTIEEFLRLLQQHAVTAVADVRSSPFSKFAKQFNKDSLRSALKENGIRYAFLGHELGARSTDPECYVNGKVQYARLARNVPFRSGLTRILQGTDTERVALMCTERDPLDCHRTILVAHELVSQGVAVAHILADGSVETHDATMLRLLDKLGMPHSDLFRSTSQLIKEALEKQEKRIAFVDSALVAQHRLSA
jgi:uncharacterized protein (DUF488 family)